MTFSDTNPPQETQKDEYPKLDEVVTVSNCFYYLSLLERFVQITRNMTEDVLKRYLVRAEYRYFQWAYCTKKSSSSLRNVVPPLDVAFFWQAHMLSPLRFYEDQQRNPQYTVIKNLKVPLKEIHEAAQKVPNNILVAWKDAMGEEPYHLLQKHVEGPKSYTSYAEISCIVCFLRMNIDWENYTEWRTDQTVALQCHRCSAMFTIKHVGKANLIADYSKTTAVAGLMLGEDGGVKMGYLDIGSLGSGKDIKSLPFNQGIKPLEKLITVNQLSKINRSKDNIPRKKRILDAIQSTYLCNPYRGSSLDLIQAVARQYKFAFKVTQVINWDLPQGIVKGIRQYINFLHLIKANPSLTAVPTFEIDLAWHTHMLFPNNYRKFTVKFLRKFLNHDDTIPESQLQKYVENTDHAWKSHTEKKQEEATAIQNAPTAPAPKIEKSLKIKLKSIFKKKNLLLVRSDGRALIGEEKEFRGYYNAGTYQASPAYNPTGNNEHIEENVDTYDVENTSFHDKRDIKEFISFKNSDTIMDEKFKSVKTSLLGFIGTSTCGTTDYLHRWESEKEKEAFGSNLEKEQYSQVFVSRGALPIITKKNLLRLPVEQRRQHANHEAMSAIEIAKRRDNATASDSFDWYKVSIIWAGTYAGTAYVANTMSARSGGIGSSCGGSGAFSSCGFSSCGGGGASSSCGGGSSSCGGGSSSCGGGGSSGC